MANSISDQARTTYIGFSSVSPVNSLSDLELTVLTGQTGSLSDKLNQYLTSIGTPAGGSITDRMVLAWGIDHNIFTSLANNI